MKRVAKERVNFYFPFLSLKCTPWTVSKWYQSELEPLEIIKDREQITQYALFLSELLLKYFHFDEVGSLLGGAMDG